jgi:uncharacterized protein
MAVDIRMNFSHYDLLGRPFGIEGVLAAMQKHDIETAVLSSALAVDSDIKQGNKELFDIIKTYDRLYGYLVVNSNYAAESVQLMRAAMNSRKFVAAALFHGSSRPYPNLDDYADILNAYRRFTKPIFVNTPHAEAVAAAEQMAREFPAIKFILGSMGGEDWKRAMTFGRLLNVTLETSGSFDAEKIEEAVECIGAHRLLFGSNLPYSDPASMLALIRSSGISEDATGKILGGNARNLLGLNRDESE